jgi:hypothetical protein
LIKSNFKQQTHEFFRGFVVFKPPVKPYEITVAFLTSFGDYACAFISNTFAELACPLAAQKLLDCVH